MKCIKTRRIQLLPLQDMTETYKYIRGLSEKLSELGNEMIRRHFFGFFEMSEKMKTDGLSKKDAYEFMKEKYGMSLQNLGYDVSKKYPEIPSSIRCSFNQKIFKKIKDEFWSYSVNKTSIPSFRKDSMAIPFNYNKNIKINEADYVFSIPKYDFKLHFGRDFSNNKIIVEKCLAGLYKPCDSQIKIINKKIFLDLTFSFESENVIIDKNKTLGVDLGINMPVAIAKGNGEYTPQIDIGGKIQITRMSIAKQRKSIQKYLKLSSGGKGQKNKVSKLEQLRNYEHNYMKTINDTLSFRIIKYCVEEGIGTIKLENLTGITRDTKSYFLKSWAYYQLQNMIEYKAKGKGIEVVFVNPEYTSQTCSLCGNVDKEQRKGVKFNCLNSKCKNFEKETNADINAALNISRKPNVEIEKLLKPKNSKKIITKKSDNKV